MTDAGHDFQRVLPMEGGHNFRDIGGYPTQDGRQVATGLVFRSGTMSELNDRDHALLDAIGLQVICDLRSNNERQRRPSRFREAATFEIWSRDYQMSTGDLLEVMREPGATPQDLRERMIAAYRTLAYEQAPSYRELFLRIANGSLPLVFHCAAGKDRTGIAAALLLDLLGVSRDLVSADYALTDQSFSRGCELVAKDPIGDRFAGVDPKVWEPLMRADPAYLGSMFDTVEARHGSGAGFLRDELGLDETIVTAIRERLLI